MSTELPANIDAAVVADSMSKILGAQVSEVRALNAAVGGQNFRIDTSVDAYTVKIADRGVIATEAWACTWANEHGVLAPEVVTTDLTETTLARPFAILRWKDGTESEPRDSAVVEAGRQLAELRRPLSGTPGSATTSHQHTSECRF